ncbi:MAG: hypothetical protein M5U11_16165 [Anaerolineales bacterium]|jgi:hypothetical protein|nr:hypothetical protein [Anaerolineales bacterium]MDX9936076.1 hypothetical protein [Anaerolineales bacterium]GER79425.1 conserved hypothetical protein [Candidatus Denitrolinea symbiosum]
MDAATVRKILAEDNPANLYDAISPALEDAQLRDALVEGCFDKREMYRYNCVRVLLRAMQLQPGLFYSYWERFAKGIDSLNGYHRASSAQALARLASVDKDDRLGSIFNRYLKLLDDPKVMVSRYFLETLPLIHRARPELRPRIVACLLSVDKTKHPPSRKELLKADVVGALDQIFDALSPKDQRKASSFAKGQLQSESPKTRKAAAAFLNKRG